MADDRLDDHDRRLRHVENEVVALHTLLKVNHQTVIDDMGRIREGVEKAGTAATENKTAIANIEAGQARLEGRIEGQTKQSEKGFRNLQITLGVVTIIIAILGYVYRF